MTSNQSQYSIDAVWDHLVDEGMRNHWEPTHALINERCGVSFPLSRVPYTAHHDHVRACVGGDISRGDVAKALRMSNLSERDRAETLLAGTIKHALSPSHITADPFDPDSNIHVSLVRSLREKASTVDCIGALPLTYIGAKENG